MLRWADVIRFAVNGNPKPDRRVEKTLDEWESELPADVFQIARRSGTERPFSSEMCSKFEPGMYVCSCCATPLFDASEKFESGSGWPSFTQPIKENAIAYTKDTSHGMQRVEVTCNTCDAHLGHVFPDGPEPSGLRYCINALSMKKGESNIAKAIFGGGCFWCTEALFTELKGVESVASGYTGGKVVNPTYKEVCSGMTGHAEVIQVEYDPQVISYEDLLKLHIATHDPTTLNRQGADVGTQYRSAIFTRTDEERNIALGVISSMQSNFDQPIVTEVTDFEVFYPAEDYHQDYYKNNTEQGYCNMVITPKVAKFRKAFAERLK